MKEYRKVVRSSERKVVRTINSGSPIWRRAEDFFLLITDFCDSVMIFLQL